jgi:glucose/arabinose dehydrogenase
MRAICRTLVGTLLFLCFAFAAGSDGAYAEPALPSGFRDTRLPLEGLTPGQGIEEPTAIRFAPGGKVFVAEKSGKVLVYDSLEDHTPSVFADLRTEVYNGNDRGLLGLALDPQFSAAHPYVYVLYAYDGPPGHEAPFWGQPGEDGDPCPEPPGSETDGCVIRGRLSRLTANLSTDKSVEENPMITDWCQQFSSHSVGNLEFDGEGNLWASGGDGASFTKVDWGQYGFPMTNPCLDPPTGLAGGEEEPPGAEGGALRAQNPQNLNGSLIRVDPETGAGIAQNPLALSLNANERRLVGKGFRNPFRFAIDPATNEVYVDNVGSSVYEEMDRFNPSSSHLYNSGWPCYEGPEKRELYAFRGLAICDHLYETPGSTSQPFFYYSSASGVTPEDPCPYKSGSAISGLAFYPGGSFPDAYDGALFFADAVRGCIYVMRTGEDGRPEPSKVEPFLTEGGLYPGIDIEAGPNGNLYYASLYSDGFEPGSIHEISYDPDAPRARLEATTPSFGATPLTVEFDAGESDDPQGEELEYEWDLDGNGLFGARTPISSKAETYANPSENKTPAVRAVDQHDHSSVAQLTVYPGDTPPAPDIEEPLESLDWGVGQPIHFAGSAVDGNGPVSPARLYWRSRIAHCPGGASSCHNHPLQVFPAVGSGTLIAPDHDLPSHIELTLTATDARGLSATKKVELSPRVANLTMQSEPPGVTLSASLETKPAPFGVEAIEGSKVTISAPQSLQRDGAQYTWERWSDGGARSHQVVAKGSTAYTAIYSTPGVEPPPPPPPPERGGVAPKTSLERHPSKKTRRSTAKFFFASDQRDSSFRCKLDRAPFAPCASPVSYRNLRRRAHSFEVFALAPSGATDTSPAEFSWKVLPKKVKKRAR